MKDFYPFWGEVYNLKSEEIIIIISFINTLNIVPSWHEFKKNNIF